MLAQQQAIDNGLPLTHVPAMLQPHTPLPIEAAENEARQRMERRGREQKAAMTVMLRREHARRGREEAARVAALGAVPAPPSLEELERVGGVEAPSLVPDHDEDLGREDTQEGDAHAPPPGQGNSSSTALRGEPPSPQPLQLL